MALMVAPGRGSEPAPPWPTRGFGQPGFYEAVDFTPAACRAASGAVVIRSHGAPPGMSFLSLAYLLLDQADAAALPRPDPSLRATELLPGMSGCRATAIYPHRRRCAGQ